MNHFLLLPVVVFAATTFGCVDTVSLLTDPPSRSDDAGLEDAASDDAGFRMEREGSVFDPEAELSVPTPVVVFEPTAPRPVLQGGNISMAWTGARYGLTWLENRAGHIFVVFGAIDPEAPSAPQSITLSNDYDDGDAAPWTMLAVWHLDRLAVFWATRLDLKVMWLDEFGTPISEPTVVFDMRGPTNFQVLPRADGYQLITVRAVASPSQSFQVYELDALARPLGDPTPLARNEAWGGAVRDRNEGTVFLWSDRVAGGTDTAWLGRVDARNRALSTTRLFEARNVVPLFVGPAGDPGVVALQDFDVGSWLQVLDGSPQLAIGPPGYGSPLILHDPEGPRLALLQEAGVYRPTNQLPTRIEARSMSYATGQMGESVVIDDGGPRGDCLESHVAAVAGPRLGIAWVMGCSERILRFTELRAFLR